MTGRIEIEGPTEMVMDDFSWLLTPKRAFPSFSTDVSGLPLSAQITTDQVEYDVPLSGYTGMVVDGLVVDFDVLEFRFRTGVVQLEQVPFTADFDQVGFPTVTKSLSQSTIGRLSSNKISRRIAQ